jgi:polyisoprenoid-binding protein YceI
MKKAIKVFSVMILSFVLVNQLVAQERYEVTSNKTTISGTSNLHDWVSSVNDLTATITIEVASGEIKSINNFNVTIPVTSIVSENGSIMDGKTYDALKYKTYPNIYFESTSVTPLSSKRLKINGKLSIASVKRSITLYVDYKVLSNGNIVFTGNQSLKMTDYKVEPPKALLGALTTGDLVTINFNLTVAGKK